MGRILAGLVDIWGEKTKVSRQQNLLRNIECEYKFALNKEYASGFVREFCAKFNEVIALRYQTLPISFTNEHPLGEFLADEKSARKESLKNEYFDTASDLLFANFRAGLRLRRSSLTQGVEQTLKCKGQENTGAAHTHKELNAHSQADLNVPDLNLFNPEDLPEGLLELTQKEQLQRKYQTDFERESITLTVPLFLTFELAVDQGDICARNGSEEHHSPICEVEFELKELSGDYLKSMGNNVYDLDDVRLEFSAFINEIMLLMAGAPKEYLDSAHLFGLVSNVDITPEVYTGLASGDSTVATITQGTATPVELSANHLDADDAADMAEAFAAAPAPAVAEAPAAAEAATAAARTRDVATNTDSAATAASVRRAMRQLSLQPSPMKAGGLIGREPFSKLKRAVLLNARFGAGAKSKAIGELAGTDADRSFRVDIAGLQNAIADYNQQPQPTLASFIVMVNKLAEGYATAMGYANLFGLRENFVDVREVIELSINFAMHHRPFTGTQISKRRHHLMCQDPELRDLSMLSVCECSSMFIEINCDLWLAPFYQQLSHALDRQSELTLDEFKRMCREASNNSYALKASEYVERLLYILKRRAMIFGFDNTTLEQKAAASAAIGHTDVSGESAAATGAAAAAAAATACTCGSGTTDTGTTCGFDNDEGEGEAVTIGSWLKDTGFTSFEEQQKIHQVALATQYHMRLMWNNI